MNSSIKFNGNQDSFRDSIATISPEGGRRWVYPKMPSGRLHDFRKLVSVVFLTLLFSGPFMTWNGHPFFLLNVLQRKFILFGIPFWPQDFFLFVLAMVTFFVFIILFTSIFGRVWCGWACPQTIFMEMVFRKIEYWIEGDAKSQRNLDGSPWNFDKTRKKLFKHTLFLFLSFVIANTFLAYIIGIEELIRLAKEGPLRHTAGFFALGGFTGVFYGVYARFREQACLVVCPYGRLQGVLLDRNSIVIAYDYKRGEPRGRMQKESRRLIGDCIDCHQCVEVCPTGIDIRNGTQLECINCTACIDACDHVMAKTGFPKGLIRFASENNVATGNRFKVTHRIIGYTILLIGLITGFVALLLSRSDVETTLLRTPGQLYQVQSGGRLSNLYNIQLVNKTFEDVLVDFLLVSEKGERIEDAFIRFVGSQIVKVPMDSVVEGVLFIELSDKSVKGLKTHIQLEVVSKGQVIDRVNTVFMGPSKINN